MARILGIDYGTKRVGVALSDESATIAQPLTTLANDNTLLESVAELAREHEVACVVIGKSIDNSGEENALQERVRGFGDVQEIEGGSRALFCRKHHAGALALK